MPNLAKSLQAVLDSFIAEDVERGLQIAVYHQGQMVADCVAGVMASSGGKVTRDTLFPVFSTSKGIAATIIHQLVERGKLSYDTSIADVWPEFAAHGKSGITVRNALNHTSGLPHMPVGISHADLYDWERICAAVAGLAPLSPPGRVCAYHAITYGYILGEVAHRVDGRPYGELVRDEIARPLGMENEMFVGIPPDAEPRVATLEMTMDEAGVDQQRRDLSLSPLVAPLQDWMNQPEARRSCSPGSSGIMTARAVAKHYAALLPGGVDGVELLPPSRVGLATAAQWIDGAQPGDAPTDKRLGYASIGFSPTSFGHAGYGGSLGFADPACSLAVGFTRNRFDNAPTLDKILATVRDELGILPKK